LCDFTLGFFIRAAHETGHAVIAMQKSRFLACAAGDRFRMPKGATAAPWKRGVNFLEHSCV